MYLEIRDLDDPDERSQTKTMFRIEDESDDQTGSEEIEDFVSALSDAYGKFYAWDVIVSQAERDSLETVIRANRRYSSSRRTGPVCPRKMSCA